MKWVFWVVLILGVIFILIPILGILQATFRAVLWFAGGALILAAMVWLVVKLGRQAFTTAPESERR